MYIVNDMFTFWIQSAVIYSECGTNYCKQNVYWRRPGPCMILATSAYVFSPLEHIVFLRSVSILAFNIHKYWRLHNSTLDIEGLVK